MVFSHPEEEEVSPSPGGEKPKMEHKTQIMTKLMFLCAVARPRYSPCGKSWWDGRLGIWPIGDWEPAK